MVAERFGGHPGVDEDEGGARRVQALPDGTRLGAELLPSEPDADIEAARDRHLDEGERPRPAEEPTDIVRVPDGRRKADSLELSRVFGKAFDRHRELRSPPLAVGELMDLVDDDVSYVFQVLAETFAHEERLQRLRGGGDEQVGGGVQRLFSPLVLRRVAVPDADRETEFPAPPLHPVKDIPVQGPEGGRDVERLEPRTDGLEEPVEDREHRALGLPCAGRRHQDQVLPPRKEPGGNSLLLRLREPGEPAFSDDIPHPRVEEVSGRLRGGRAWPVSRRTCHLRETPPHSFRRCTGRGGPSPLSRSRPTSIPPANSLKAGTKRSRVRSPGRLLDRRVEVGRAGACGAPDGVDERDDRVVVADDDEVTGGEVGGAGWV